MDVLVGYATANGSTLGVAERIAARLVGYGHHLSVLAIDQIGDVSAYDAVVVGSAVHGQAWLPEAARFVHHNTAVLARRPVWLFSVGMPGALPRFMRGWAMQEGPKAVAPFAAVHARGSRLFSGVIRPHHLPLTGRIALRLMGGRYGDFRDWAEIDRWADTIARQLAPAPHGEAVR